MQEGYQLETMTSLPVWQKILLIFWEPKETFRSLKAQTHWLDIVIPLILVMAMVITATKLVNPITLKDVKAMITQSEKLSDEQKTLVLERVEKQQNSPWKYVGIVISLVIKVLVVAGVFSIVNNFIFAGEARFIQALAVTAYVNLIDIVGWAVRLPLIFARETIRIYTGPGLFIEESKTFMFNFLAGLDVFAFWKVVLLASGVSVFTRKSFKSALSIFLIFWLIYVAGAAALSGLAKI